MKKIPDPCSPARVVRLHEDENLLMVGTRITILCHQRLCKALHHKRVHTFSKLKIFFWAGHPATAYSSTVFGETHCTVRLFD